MLIQKTSNFADEIGHSICLLYVIHIMCWGCVGGLKKVMPADATSPSLRRLIFSTLTCLCQERAVSGAGERWEGLDAAGWDGVGRF